MTYKIYHVQGVVKVIDASLLPKEPSDLYTDVMYAGAHRDEYQRELSTALSTKGVEIVGLDGLTQQPNMKRVHFFYPGHWFATTINENQLYDLPSGFEVKIEEQRYQIDDGPGEYEYIQVAAIVPVALPEKTETPAHPEESQDELWRSAFRLYYSEKFTEAAMNSKEYKELKSRFTIQRKP